MENLNWLMNPWQFDCVVDEAMSRVLPESEGGTRNLVHYQVVLKCALVDS
jgi:hypothetical protein